MRKIQRESMRVVFHKLLIDTAQELPEGHQFIMKLF